jgi:hypothetical protein
MTVRRFAISALIVACFQAAHFAPVFAGSAQVVKGRVLAPTVKKCGFFAFQEAVLKTAAGVQDVFTFSFDVAPITRGKPFSLKSKTRGADFDLWFQGSSAKRFANRKFGGEHGVVPAGATRAHVCVHVGAAASFVYKAG